MKSLWRCLFLYIFLGNGKSWILSIPLQSISWSHEHWSMVTVQCPAVILVTTLTLAKNKLLASRTVIGQLLQVLCSHLLVLVYHKVQLFWQNSQVGNSPWPLECPFLANQDFNMGYLTNSENQNENEYSNFLFVLS